MSNLTGSYGHFCYDGYQIKKELLASEVAIQTLVRAIDSNFFNEQSCIKIINCMDCHNPQMVGISGVILGQNSHFTIHTFSEMRAVFIDYFGGSNSNNEEELLRLLTRQLAPGQSHLCLQEFASGLGNFGQHLLYRRPALDYKAAEALIAEIVHAIQMTPLCEMLILKDKDLATGYDILQPIEESHISIHTADKYSHIDVFSCRTFDTQKTSTIIGVPPIKQVKRGVYLPPA